MTNPTAKTPLPGRTGQALVVGENTVITLNFVVRDEDQNVLDDMYAKTPFKFLFRQGDLPPGLEEGIAGLQAGQSKTFIIPAAHAHGERNKDLVVRIPRRQLTSEDCVVGSRYRRLNAEGESELFTVMGYIGQWVYLDPNHPWAGRQLEYEVHIVEVHPLTEPAAAVQDERKR